MKEEWRDIAGYEGLYQVSNFGRVKSMSHWQTYSNGDRHFYKGHILTPGKGPTGYLSVRLGSKGREAGVHRLVAETFLKRGSGENEVNHIDGDKANNRVDNLEWVTRKENMRHCRVILKKQTGRGKISVCCVETGEIFESLSQAAKTKQLSIPHLSQALKGERRIVGGYHWEAVEMS